MAHAVSCCLESSSGGYAKIMPISDLHPLAQCRHFVAAFAVDQLSDAAVAEYLAGGTEFEAMYHGLGLVPVGTVCDGDCGIDVMSQMLGNDPSAATFQTLRTEIHDYLVARLDDHWMAYLMAALQELTKE